MLFCRTKSRVDFACCSGPNMELMGGAFLSASFFFVFCLFWIESVQWYVNDWNTV